MPQPTGVTRDPLSAWWLPVALPPPAYALAAPAVLGLDEPAAAAPDTSH